MILMMYQKMTMKIFFMFCENVGFEEHYVTYAMYKEYMHKYKINNLVETEYIIEKQRMIKDEEEMHNITKACNITDDCFKYILKIYKTWNDRKANCKRNRGLL